MGRDGGWATWAHFVAEMGVLVVGGAADHNYWTVCSRKCDLDFDQLGEIRCAFHWMKMRRSFDGVGLG